MAKGLHQSCSNASQGGQMYSTAFASWPNQNYNKTLEI